MKFSKKTVIISAILASVPLSAISQAVDSFKVLTGSPPRLVIQTEAQRRVPVLDLLTEISNGAGIEVVPHPKFTNAPELQSLVSMRIMNDEYSVIIEKILKSSGLAATFQVETNRLIVRPSGPEIQELRAAMSAGAVGKFSAMVDQTKASPSNATVGLGSSAPKDAATPASALTRPVTVESPSKATGAQQPAQAEIVDKTVPFKLVNQPSAPIATVAAPGAVTQALSSQPGSAVVATSAAPSSSGVAVSTAQATGTGGAPTSARQALNASLLPSPTSAPPQPSAFVAAQPSGSSLSAAQVAPPLVSKVTPYESGPPKDAAPTQARPSPLAVPQVKPSTPQPPSMASVTASNSLSSSWDLRSGTDTAKSALVRWSQRAGWNLLWEVENIDFSIQKDQVFTGDFLSASERVIDSIKKKDPSITATAYRGNKVLRIYKMGQ